MNHNKVLTVVAIIVFLCIITVAVVHNMNHTEVRKVSINEDISQVRPFHVEDDKTGSYTDGTIFVIGSGDSTKVRIVATLYIGPNDSGGVSFASVEVMDPTSIICSYRNDISQTYVASYRVADEFGSVMVARGNEFVGGGTGYIDILFEPRVSFESENVKSLEFRIGTGSEDYADGTGVWGRTWEKIIINLSN